MLACSACRAAGEYQRSLDAKADFPEPQMVIAGTALVFRDYRVVEHVFSETVRIDPQRIEAWAKIARLRAARSDLDGARKALLEGIAAYPNAPNLRKLLRDLRRPDSTR